MLFLDTRPAAFDDPLGADALAQFRCDHPRDVIALLRQLRDSATPVALSGPGGSNLVATVWTIDVDRQRLAFDVEAGDTRLPALVEGNEATGVAYLEAVKLQFDLQDLVLVRSPRASALQARLPSRLYRFQRRNSYRVRTLDRAAPRAHLRHPALPDMQLALRIVDLSIGGCALMLPDKVPPLPMGVTLSGVQLELDAGPRLEVTLRLQHASSMLSNTPGLRMGCEWLGLASSTERALQRYIDQTQKRRRLLSLD
jgi:c-di-GMP-binding flagellar brake protein YcgR